MNDSISAYVSIVAAAAAAGIVNALAGGGTLLTFPALVGLVSPVLANGTSTVALSPGSLASVWGYRRELRSMRRMILLLLPSSILGGCIGSLLVTQLPANVFAGLVPWLILSATVLFILQPFVTRMTRTAHRPLPEWMLVTIQFLIGVYGGYFGAGIGILMLASLAFMGQTDIHEMNALKAVQAFAINVVAAAEFIRAGNVVWPYALAMAGASIIGGYLGAHYGRMLDRTLVRWIVIAIGISLSIYYFAH